MTYVFGQTRMHVFQLAGVVINFSEHKFCLVFSPVYTR